MTSCEGAARLATLVALGLAAAGCGLKGPLAMPERSTNVVIRGPGGQPVTDAAAEPQAAPVEAAPAAQPAASEPIESAPAPAGVPAGRPRADRKPTPADDRMPPPPLPGGNRGG